MDINIITAYPLWYLLLCMMAGVLASMALYFRERHNEFPVWLKRLLGVNRFLLVSIIAFLLLSPLLKQVSFKSEKPIIVFAQDNSLSVVLGSDSSFYKDAYRDALNTMLDELHTDYELSLFTFGEEVNAISGYSYDSLGFSEKLSDMSSLFDVMDVRFFNRNTAALIIAGDGIYNQGLNPVYRASGSSYPIYTIALGDTAIRRDVYLKRVHYNRIAYQGNDFPLELIVNASKFAGSMLTLSVSEKGETIFSRQIQVNGNNFSKTLRIRLTAGEAGIHHYIVRITSNRKEITRENNRYDLFIDVLKSKQKILILANSPHPDITAIKDAIGSKLNYEVEDYLANKFNGPLQEYSLLIMHQMPSSGPASGRLLNEARRAGVPILFIVGSQTDLAAFNAQKAGMQINAYNRFEMNEHTVVMNNEFTLFSISDETMSLIPELPPLHVRFARYNVFNSASVLFYQKAGSIVSNEPACLFYQARDRKTGIIAGTGLWRWRMKSWLITGDHAAFNEIINKSIRFLAVKEDKRQFRVNVPANIPEYIAVELNAELYNDSYDPINEPDVALEITDDTGNTYDFVFGRSAEGYSLNAGNFPVGTYSFRANTRIGEDVYTDEGGFTVTPVIVEQTSLRAAHDVLEELAVKNDGSMLAIEQLDKLPELLRERGDIKAVLHAEKKFIEFIDIWWILLTVLALLGLEWFLRKWSGSY